MRRSVLVAVALLLGCRPGPEPGAVIDADPREPPTSAGDSGEPAPPTKPAPSTKAEPPTKPERPASEGTPCERTCADVHACVRADESERVAAAIELSCLDACVRAPTGFAACERPPTIDPDACAPLLACTRAAWPEQDRPSTIVESPPPGDGCLLACTAYAECFGGTQAQVRECAAQCREALDEVWQRAALDCARLDGCHAIMDCVSALPGA